MVGRNDQYMQVVPDSIQRVGEVYSKSIHACYGSRIVCHTVESKRYNGRIINDLLPPYKMVIAKLMLTERELTIIWKVLDGFSSG